jgi:hypothetical protein
MSPSVPESRPGSQEWLDPSSLDAGEPTVPEGDDPGTDADQYLWGV